MRSHRRTSVTKVAGATVVHIENDSRVNARDCAMCDLPVTDAVRVIKRLIEAGRSFVMCRTCCDRTTDEVHRLLSKGKDRLS